MTIHNTTRKGIVLLLLATLKRHPAQLDPAPGRGYISAMPPRRSSKKDSPAKLAGRMKRRWRVVLLRHKGEILGTVEPTWHPHCNGQAVVCGAVARVRARLGM